MGNSYGKPLTMLFSFNFTINNKSLKPLESQTWFIYRTEFMKTFSRF